MKTFIGYFTLILLAVIGIAYYSRFQMVLRRPPIIHEQISPDVVRQIPMRIKLLKPGMTQMEVVRKLGLSGYPSGTMEGGSSGHFQFVLPLNTNCFVMLRYDMDKKPPSFLDAEVFGDGWKASSP